MVNSGVLTAGIGELKVNLIKAQQYLQGFFWIFIIPFICTIVALANFGNYEIYPLNEAVISDITFVYIETLVILLSISFIVIEIVSAIPGEQQKKELIQSIPLFMLPVFLPTIGLIGNLITYIMVRTGNYQNLHYFKELFFFNTYTTFSTILSVVFLFVKIACAARAHSFEEKGDSPHQGGWK